MMNDNEVDATYRECFPQLMRVAFLMTGSNAAAEDVVHDVFVRCIGRLDSIDHPPSYLRVAVVNECRRQIRRGTAASGLPETAEELPYDSVELLAALAELSDRKRAAVVLRYFVDIPDREIARILRCRPSTVRSLLHRAIGELKESLQ